MRIDSIGRSSSVIAPQKPVVQDAGAADESQDLSAVSAQEAVVAAQSVQGTAGQDEEDKPVITDKMLEKALEQANKSLAQFDRVIERSVHEKTKTIMYVIRDTKTHEVIGEFPPKKIQDMIAKMWELAGLFVDEKA